ncbi:MAG TPA: pyrroloquinoline quinone-dependent dehydrogenase [Gammaproteobacteria bacterium]|nr:pyrroloquinoline quinone-dependent dehydrogenase [Gammaproteobacteria bacterium]
MKSAQGIIMKIAGILTLPLILLSCTPESIGTDIPSNSNWDTYLGDNARTHYSPLTQITRNNVEQLELAWSYDSGELREGGSTMYTSPLVVDGVLYSLSPKLVAFALNAATGEEIWRYDTGGNGAPQRGLMWWQEGNERRLIYAAGRELIALDAGNGEPVESFGEDGRLDLRPSADVGPFFTSVPGIVFENMLIMGFSTSESSTSHAGMIRAFDVRTGAEIWRFNSLPLTGGLGSDTWEEGALLNSGGANNWTGMTLDEERGMLFIPTGSATPDFYGASRKGDNLFANSLVALDVHTGSYRWHYQTIRHDLWDRDLPSPPTLVQLERNGVLVDGVAVTTKSGHLFLFNRDTGESLYDIYEVDGIASTLPGEQAADSQPVSSVAFTRQEFEMTTRNQEAIDHVTEVVAPLDQRPWASPTTAGILFYPSYDGGAEWGGSAYDPNGHKLILNAQEIGGIIRLFEIPVGFSNRGVFAENCAGCHGENLAGTDRGVDLTGITDRLSTAETRELIVEGRGAMPSFDSLDQVEINAVVSYIRNPEQEDADQPSTEIDYAFAGYLRVRDHEALPGNTPPWGTLNSIDLATGEIDWQVNFGNYPSHPDLDYGAESYGGPVVTESGVIFIGATPDRMFRAYDSVDGSILWSTELPAAGFATPAVYSVDGQQFVVIAAGGGRMGPPSSSQYLAYSLPNNENDN